MVMQSAARNSHNAQLSTNPVTAAAPTDSGHARTRSISVAASAAIAVLLLLLPADAAQAQSGPFAPLSGSWSGAGSIGLSSGSRERVQCRATYSVRSGGSNLGLSLRCAGDSYNFNFRGDASYRGGTVSGSWSETSMGAAGRFLGRATGERISARVQGANFNASLAITTRGDRQSISIRSPGSQFSDVTIALRRR